MPCQVGNDYRSELGDKRTISSELWMMICNKTGMTECPSMNCSREYDFEKRHGLRAQPSCLCDLFEPLLLFEALL